MSLPQTVTSLRGGAEAIQVAPLDRFAFARDDGEDHAAQASSTPAISMGATASCPSRNAATARENSGVRR